MKKMFIVIIATIAFLFIGCDLTGPSDFGSFAEKWVTSVSEDEMTGDKSWFAFSPETSATNKMDFPYSDVKAQLIIGNDGESEWVYIWFSTSPNLLNTSIGDGYRSINTRIKWDSDEPESTRLTQVWGSQFLQFTDDDIIITKIVEKNIVLVELNWYGNGKVYFEFSLAGAEEAINKIRRNS